MNEVEYEGKVFFARAFCHRIESSGRTYVYRTGEGELQPEKVRNNPEFLEILKRNQSWNHSCCCAMDEIIPKEILELQGNLDASIFMRLFFRKYRGAAPNSSRL